MGDIKTHKDLFIWQDSIKLVTEIYKITGNFPSIERFCLISQIRRAAVSIPSNIAEGASRRYEKEFIQFLYISLGSLSEIETQFIISNNLKYIQTDSLDDIMNKIVILKKGIYGLIKKLKKGPRNEGICD